ncbi:MAG TPA: hypothetical protein VFT59_00485 [Candidatus Saccharimonadales bacterium]|nr:hypothetical protein [Candidatus Saccharimonadales bacterium]
MDEMEVDLQNMATPPLECSRLEMRAEEGLGVVILIRTKPELTRQLFSAEPYQYPMMQYVNHGIIFGTVARHMEAGVIVPAFSELNCAMRVEPDRYGAEINQEAHTFIVPRIKFNKRTLSARSRLWAGVLLNDPHNGRRHELWGKTDVHLMHLPDMPMREIPDEQLRHLATLNYGWNPVQSKPSMVGLIQQMMTLAAEGARTVAIYE